MIRKTVIGIDARMVESSGIGTYTQHIIASGLYDYAIGKENEIRRYNKKIKIIPFDAPIYSPQEQLFFPIKQVRESGIDLMHFPHYNVPLFYKGDFVVTVHDLTHLVFPEYLGNKIKYYYAKHLMTHAVQKAKHVFTVSEYSKKDIIRFFRIPENKITVTYNAIDADFIIKEKNEIKYLYEKYSIPESKRIILYVGNLKPHKNLSTLLRAFKLIKREDIILLLVGKAFKNTGLEEQEIELGIKERVIHTGLVSKKELVDLYNLADLFVFPSLYEGFGIPPLEAMACGTPVIGANNSSIPEVVGDAAVLVDARCSEDIMENIIEVLENEDKRKRMILAGKERTKQYSWTNTVYAIKEVIENMS